MRNTCRGAALVLAGAMIGIVPRAQAAALSLDVPVAVSTGWTRIAGRYESTAADPEFRVVLRCGTAKDVHVLQPVVHLAPAAGALWLDLPGTPDRLLATDTPCELPALSVEMRIDSIVIASAAVPQHEVAVIGRPTVASAPTASPSTRRFHLQGDKYVGSPFGKRTEAGVSWTFDSRVSVQLNYERTSQAPMMPFDHDDGFLTRLQVRF